MLFKVFEIPKKFFRTRNASKLLDHTILVPFAELNLFLAPKPAATRALYWQLNRVKSSDPALVIQRISFIFAEPEQQQQVTRSHDFSPFCQA